jgi:hypothetical protein
MLPLNIPTPTTRQRSAKRNAGSNAHQEMASRHGERAEQNRAAPAEDTVSEEAAEDRREINQGCVGTEDPRGERLAIEPAINGKLTKNIENRDVLDPPRQQEILDHVKDKERLHAVVGKAFPRLGEGEEPKPARMPEEIRFVFFAGQRRGILGLGGSGHGRRW